MPHAALCSNYQAQLLTPIYKPIIETDGRFSAFLSGVLPGFELELLRVYEQSCCFIYSQLIMLNCKQSVCFSSADNYPLVNISLKYLQHLATAQNCYIKMNILSQ